MVIIKKGNLLEATEDIICHQCNTEGIFGGGIAYQIKQKFPKCEEQSIKYVKYCEQFKFKIIGTYIETFLNDDHHGNKGRVANCFTQNKDYTTNYREIKTVFTKIKNDCKRFNKSIAIPYNYGCGIAKGEWQKVEEILIDIFDDYDITIYKYEEEYATKQ